MIHNTDTNSRPKFKLQQLDKFRDMNKLKNFEILKKLGKGTFGVVQKARNIKTGQVVALKQLLNHSAKEGFPITAMREITIVKKLNHENVLKIIEMIYEDPKTSTSQDPIHQRGCFYTVSPYMWSDLVGILSNPKVVLRLRDIKCLMSQLLHGIQYIHESKYLHRDVKAANILIDERGILKIADFGLARVYHGKIPKLGTGPGGGERQYTGLVVTRWYRPPEILLGERKYTTSVDMWGVGCVFGELFTGQPILNGTSDNHQCQLIFSLMGPPNKDWPDVMELPNKTDINIGLTCKRSFEEQFSPLIQNDYAVSLLDKLLALNPYNRLNALEALQHPFFHTDPKPTPPQDLRFEECHEIDKNEFKKSGQARKTYIPDRQVATPVDEKRPIVLLTYTDHTDSPPRKMARTNSSRNTPEPAKPIERSVPIVARPAVPTPPPIRATSGIFMPKKKKQLPQRPPELAHKSQNSSYGADTAKTPDWTPKIKTPVKVTRTPTSQTPKSERMDFESDLTDFEDDISNDKLKSLDLERYSISRNSKN